MNQDCFNILIVNSDKEAREELQSLLALTSFSSFQIFLAENMNAACRVLENQSVAAILIDQNVPDSFVMQGLLAITSETAEIAIVYTSDEHDEEFGIAKISSGAQDYVVKKNLEAKFLERTILFAIKRQVRLVKLRSSLLLAEREKNRAKSRLLGSQMNPHFIFNLLNVAQFYILRNQPAIAQDYISRLAAVMRVALDHSREEFVHISDEIEFLNSYIELQRERYGFEFSVSIQVDEEMQDDNIHIPPMLLQPFIENAIVHGLVNKLDRSGELLVNIELSDQYLVCRILDNGPGFDAKNDKSNESPAHRSHALTIANDRIELLNYQGLGLFSLNIKKRENTAGTVVELRCPLID
jgi:LytS/YehU family sensor histidine kinase